MYNCHINTLLISNGLKKSQMRDCVQCILIDGVLHDRNNALAVGKIYQNTGFLLIFIFLYKDRIKDSALLRKNTAQRKPAYWHILPSVKLANSSTCS